jgi:hypothetical protein
MTILMYLFFFSGVFVGALSVPMLTGKIPSDGLYCLRV